MRHSTSVYFRKYVTPVTRARLSTGTLHFSRSPNGGVASALAETSRAKLGQGADTVKMTDLRAKVVNAYAIHYLKDSTMCVILILTIWHVNLSTRKWRLEARWGFFTGQLAQGGGPWKSC